MFANCLKIRQAGALWDPETGILNSQIQDGWSNCQKQAFREHISCPCESGPDQHSRSM